LMEVFSELKRVLKPTGTFYLNIGDTYSGGGGVSGKPEDHEDLHDDSIYPSSVPARNGSDLPDKCMSMIPEGVAFAMVNDGWILRNKIIWKKVPPMPESCEDRFTTSYEFVYMFTLNQKYYFDMDAVREPLAEATKERSKYHWCDSESKSSEYQRMDGLNRDEEYPINEKGRHPRDVWEISTANFSKGHFAKFPEELCEKPIKASCPKKVCSECGKPWERETEKKTIHRSELPETDPRYRPKKYGGTNEQVSMHESGMYSERKTKGWKKTCDCDTEETKPGIVLDPFAGAGTTLLKAWELGRDFIGIELNEEYVEDIIEPRLSKTNSERLDKYME